VSRASGAASLSLQQIQREFNDRNKKLKSALTGIGHHSSQQRLSGGDAAIVSTKEIMKSLHPNTTRSTNNKNELFTLYS